MSSQQGYRKTCADRSTSHVAIRPGCGYVYLADSIKYEYTYPLFATSWSPMLSGSSLVGVWGCRKALEIG